MDPKCGFDVKPESSGAGTTSLWTWLRRGGRATPLKQKSSAGKFQQSRKLKVGMGGGKELLGALFTALGGACFIPTRGLRGADFGLGFGTHLAPLGLELADGGVE